VVAQYKELWTVAVIYPYGKVQYTHPILIYNLVIVVPSNFTIPLVAVLFVLNNFHMKKNHQTIRNYNKRPSNLVSKIYNEE